MLLGGIITKELGVIGGLGPMATAYFMELVVGMTEAKYDREHIPMVVFNRPSAPDRTEYILGQSKESPLGAIVSMGKQLESLGVGHIAIPCVTAHYFYYEILRHIGVPIINMLSETAEYLKSSGVVKAGIMATDGTIRGGFFKKELERQGIEVVTPGEQAQNKVMDIIYNQIKANKPYNLDDFKYVANELKEQGAEVIILGCTELSLIKRDGRMGSGFLDAMEVLAARSIVLSEGRLKDKYLNLIT